MHAPQMHCHACMHAADFGSNCTNMARRLPWDRLPREYVGPEDHHTHHTDLYYILDIRWTHHWTGYFNALRFREEDLVDVLATIQLLELTFGVGCRLHLSVECQNRLPVFTIDDVWR